MDVEECFTTSEARAAKSTTRAVGNPFALLRRHEKTVRANVCQDEAVCPFRNQKQPSVWDDYHYGTRHQTIIMEEPPSPGRKGHDHPYINSISYWLSLICDEIEMSHPFVRKLMILCIQFILTFALTMCSMVYVPIQFILKRNTIPMLIMLYVFVFTYCFLIFAGPLRRKFPLNYVFLLMCTISMSYVTACFSSLFHVRVLRVVVPTNMIICFMALLLSCQRRLNISKWFCIIAPALIFMFALGIITLVSTFLGCRRLWVICGGCVFPHFTVFLLYDFMLYSAFKRFFILPYYDISFGRKAYGILTGQF